MEVEFGVWWIWRVWMGLRGLLLEESMEWMVPFSLPFRFFFLFDFLRMSWFLVKGNRSFMWSGTFGIFTKLQEDLPIDHHWLWVFPLVEITTPFVCFSWHQSIGVVQMIPQLVLTKGCWKASVQRMVIWYVCWERMGRGELAHISMMKN